jgi:hypothetical protein
MDDHGIDLVKYGVLWQKVQDMDKKMDKMDTQLEQLVALANKGRGGFWAGMVFASLLSTAIGFAIGWIKK